jgi:ABC-type Fe3+-hydroxamate transport system substrate-binding protein
MCAPALTESMAPLQDQDGRIPHAQFEAALQALLGYAPKVVHLAAASLAEVWQDMQKIADAVGKGTEGKRLVQQLKQRMEVASTSCRGRSRWRVACVQWPVGGKLFVPCCACCVTMVLEAAST